MTLDIESFGSSDDPFAIRFKRSDLPGLLSKTLTVPAGALALVRSEGGEASALEASAETTDVQDGVLVQERCRIECTVEAGRSEDNHAFTASFELELRPGATVIDLTQLEANLLGEEAEITQAALRAHFEPYLAEALRFFVAARTSEALAHEDLRRAVDDQLREQLKKPLFETGLALHDLLHPKFSSPDFAAEQDAEAEQGAAAEALAREKELVELKKGLDRHALLMDIELRDEADRARKDLRLERYERIRTQMGDDDVKALVMMLDDGAQRAALIRELIEKDMSPDQRAKLKVSEMEVRVEERLVELQQRLSQLTGAELESRDTDPITRRVICVVGKRLLAFDPKTNLHPEVPKEVYETDGGSLGYLRSVRSETIEGEEYLLAGAQRGVYRLNGKLRHEHPFPTEPRGKGGVNAIAYFDGRIFATHSEMGLIEWPLDGAPGRSLCEEYLKEAGSIRGAAVHEGTLYFSAGSDLYALDVATGSATPTRFKGSDDSITSFAVVKGELLAGNRSGKIYRWSLDDPGSPTAFGVMKKNPIFMIKPTVIAGQRFFIIGSKDFTVTAAEPRKDLYREYQAREEVRWVDGAADFVFGVSRSGYKVFCWDAHRQSEPKLTIRVSDKVQDLFVVKMLPQKA